jgi:hypothetical protein
MDFYSLRFPSQVLVLNAGQHCPTLGPLLDNHTRRHHSYLRDTFPHLIPAAASSTSSVHTVKAGLEKTRFKKKKTSSVVFLFFWIFFGFFDIFAQ